MDRLKGRTKRLRPQSGLFIEKKYEQRWEDILFFFEYALNIFQDVSIDKSSVIYLLYNIYSMKGSWRVHGEFRRFSFFFLIRMNRCMWHYMLWRHKGSSTTVMVLNGAGPKAFNIFKNFFFF